MFYAIDERRPKLAGGGHFVAENASVIGSVTLNDRSSVWFGCVLRGDVDEIIIGEGSNVQDGAVLHTDAGLPLNLGRDCTVGHMAMLHGCTVGDNTLIGIRSVVLNRAVIGRNSIVAAGSLVPEGKAFPDGVLLMGSPAKVMRELEPQEIRVITLSAQHYVQNARRYLERLSVLPQP
jgi:carbonic anhydrase/acetyltransferase-like protein (isoleucine patch superfamily)